MRVMLAGLVALALLSAACGGDERFDCYVYGSGWGHFYDASSAGDAEDKCEQDFFDCDCG